MFNDVSKRLKKWDYGGYTTIEINTSSLRISLDKSFKFYTNQISYVEIIEIEPPSFLYGFRTYYAIVNVIMRFHLIDEKFIDFNFQNATQLIKIINILRQLGVNVII